MYNPTHGAKKWRPGMGRRMQCMLCGRPFYEPMKDTRVWELRCPYCESAYIEQSPKVYDEDFPEREKQAPLVHVRPVRTNKPVVVND